MMQDPGRGDKAEVSGLTDNPEDVFAAELEYIRSRRGAADQPALPEGGGDRFSLNLAGLALSGGGIRSATFNLGLLQALAKKGLFARFDYLSTVSGGGYIGSSLTSLLSSGSTGVRAEDFPFRFDGREEGAEVKWLRAHSNYLVPRRGALSLSLWRLLSSYLVGLLFTLATTGLIVAFVSASILWLYPPLAGWVAAMRGHPIKLGHDILRHPFHHYRVLFTPALVVLGLWAVLAVIYVLFMRSAWTYSNRARFNLALAQVLRAAAGAAVLGALPLVFALVHDHVGRLWQQLTALVTTSGLGWLSVWLGKGLAPSKSVQSGPVRRALILAVMWLFLVVIVIAMAYPVWLNHVRWAGPIAGLALLGLVFLTSFSDFNRVSMFFFYRDRLSEAYIFKRAAGAAPAMTSNDELQLADTVSRACGGPYPLINTTLNLSSSGSLESSPRQSSLLELRGRQADFFLLSPRYCGSTSTGYVPTKNYDRPPLTLASAMSISGAALNPELGPKTHPALAFLMGLLNVRLGVWAQNPRVFKKGRAIARRAKSLWPLYFFRELVSDTDQWGDLVDLSDGGHLENLGVYELLRRRCRLIVASDVSADPDRHFEDLGNLIRKARIDLGIQVEIDLTALRPAGDPPLSVSHVAVGRIAYPNVDESPLAGVLIYVKPGLIATDPGDLRQYAASHTDFPHDSTIDQFFDEAQFESYRELGYQSGVEVARSYGAQILS